jgi:hypothetical protein
MQYSSSPLEAAFRLKAASSALPFCNEVREVNHGRRIECGPQFGVRGPNQQLMQINQPE